MGLPVEEFDDLSEDEEGRESLRRQLRNPAVRGPANEREEDLLGLVNDREDAGIYALTEDVNDLIMTHLFDSRQALTIKVKTLSNEPDRLSTKDIERLVSIICEYSTKYHVLFAD